MAKTLPILKLKPTQFALGMYEVNYKMERIREMKKAELKDFLKKHPIAVVRAPNMDYYIIDGHHHVAACWQAGVRELRINLVHDFSKSSLVFKKFWTKMHDKNWCHLYDKFGDGPRKPMYLAHDIRGLADDPYRSLAWMVCKEGGFKASTEPFWQFQWANFFRHQEVFIEDFDLDFKKALKHALRLAKSPRAKHLPGYSRE